MMQDVFMYVLITCIGALSVFLCAFIATKASETKAKTESIQDEDVAKRINEYITLIEKDAIVTVGAVEQSFVKKMKETGNWNETTMKQALSIAMKNVLTNIGPDIKVFLEMVKVDVVKYVENLIEYYVGQG